MREDVNVKAYQPVEVARQPVSADVLRTAENLANRAQRLSDQVGTKLQPVMAQDCPRPCGATATDGKEYPPLFADLRNNFIAIESALDSIEASINRTEL